MRSVEYNTGDTSMRSVTDEKVEEILAANDIVDVVSGYVKLEKKGKYFFGLCPFHNEKTPSFSVTPSKQIFYCYSCQKGGNAFHFLMQVENLRYIEAVKMLAEKSNITFHVEYSEEEIKKFQKNQQLIEMYTEAARFYHENLVGKQGEKARQYLAKRQISHASIIKFGLGYAPNEEKVLLRHLIQKKFNQQLIQESGLVLAKQSHVKDRFYGRLMFPIFDLRGNVIAFGARVLDERLPKYLNSPETLIYNKSKNLYGLNFARKIGSKKLLVVEGYMDAVSLYQWNIPYVVASLGTSLTQEQAKLLRTYASEVIIAYDADAAGQKATLRGLDMLEAMGIHVKVLQLPQGKDPDEYIRLHGTQKFEQCLENALSFLEYKVANLKASVPLNTTMGQAEFLNKTADILARVNNSIERELYIKKLSREYPIREETLFAEVIKRTQGLLQPPKKQVVDAKKTQHMEQKSKTKTGENKTIKVILSLLVLHNDLYRKNQQIMKKALFHGDEGVLYEAIIDRIQNGRGIRPDEFLNMVQAEQASMYVYLMEKECTFENPERALADLLKSAEREQLKKRQSEILELLKGNAVKDETTIRELQKELFDILTRMKGM